MLINLLKILNMLRNSVENSDCSYYVPEAWNTCGFKDYWMSVKRPGEIQVNPYAFLAHHLENLLEPVEKGRDISNIPVPLTNKVMYGMLPRMFTAWNHGEDSEIGSGTFLKCICLIPYLKRMNVSIIYLLPIFKHSNLYKKGTLGSPYAIKNVYMLDEHLHDDLLGAYSEELLDIEFKAFVEACHLSGIKVVVDFVFRTVARDSDLILSHPDWFYWIDAKFRNSFRIPDVEEEKEHTLMSDKALPSLYRSRGIKDYLSSFRPAPNVKNSSGWADLVSICRKANENILEYAEKVLGITTVPGFSDVINDSQPPWTDVTYLRYYFDVHEKAQKYVSKRQAPYILQDGAKLNLYRGKEKNTELWEYIAAVIPHYQTNYGIDGARIDMGHALPPELNREIVTRTRRLDPGFLLWSEEFNVRNSTQAKKDGFDFITSMIWFLCKDIAKPGFHKKLVKTLATSEVPVTGALETPDTPRAAANYRDRKLLNVLFWLNCFLPNSVLFINNGQDLMEVQPMNLGLDNTEEGRFLLEKGDPMYGKLAFFDPYVLHWLSSDRVWMTSLLSRATACRHQFAPLLSDPGHFVNPFPIFGGNTSESGLASRNSCQAGKVLPLFYHNRQNGDNVFLLANSSTKRKYTVFPAMLYPGDLPAGIRAYQLLCRDTGGEACMEYGPGYNAVWDPSSRMDPEDHELGEPLVLQPGEVVIGRFLL